MGFGKSRAGTLAKKSIEVKSGKMQDTEKRKKNGSSAACDNRQIQWRMRYGPEISQTISGMTLIWNARKRKERP